MGIAYNKAIDHLRYEGRRPTSRIEDIQAKFEPVIDPMEDVPDPFDKTRVNKAIAGLPVEQQRVVRDFYFESLPLDEISKRTNAPLGTVKSRLRLALGHLREALGSR